MMKKGYVACMMMITVASLCRPMPAKAAEVSPGEQGFQQHCAVCHPNGGNIIDPKDTLDKKTLEKKGIRRASDIVAKMRNPDPRMTKFDKETVPDKTATAIAEYILKTFK
jgi:cytochrome c6